LVERVRVGENISCRLNGTLIAYVPFGVSLPGVLALVRGRGKVRSVNEELRRITVSGSYNSIVKLREKLMELGIPPDKIAMEIVFVCKAGSDKDASLILRRSDVRIRRNNIIFVAGLCNGMIFQAEIKGNKIIIKAGRKSRLKVLRALPPPSEFVHSIPLELSQLESLLDCVFSKGENRG
jgi:hypothetical protein